MPNRYGGIFLVLSNVNSKIKKSKGTKSKTDSKYKINLDNGFKSFLKQKISKCKSCYLKF